MAVPRNRSSNSRKHTRRSHHAKKPAHFASCASCGEVAAQHSACTKCGHYRGRIVALVAKRAE